MLEELTDPFTWEKYSKRTKQKIASPRNFGRFLPSDLEGRALRLVSSTAGQIERGAQLTLHALIDLEDGVLVDVRYELFGPSVLVAALESCVEIVVGKNYDQAKRISHELIDKHLREDSDKAALPVEANPYLHLISEALEKLSSQCTDIALPAQYVHTPLPDHILEYDGGIPNWPELTDAEKLEVIKQIMDRDVRPYVEMDAGGVEVLRLVGHQVFIAYSGACNGCFSSTGSTLSSIQAILRAKVHPSLEVIPEL